MDRNHITEGDYRSQPRSQIFADALIDYYIKKHPLSTNPHAKDRAIMQCRKACEQAMHGFPNYPRHQVLEEAQDVQERQRRIDAALALDTLAKRTAKCTRGISSWTWEHADADESAVRDITNAWYSDLANAKTARMKATREAMILAKLGASSPPDKGISPQWIRRRMRSQIRRAQEATHLLFHDIGKSRQEYASEWTTKNRQQQLALQSLWMRHTEAINQKTGEAFKLTDIAKTAERRLAEALAIIKAMEERGQYTGYKMLFVTITLPSEYHANPEYGTNSWDGSSPRDGHLWITKRWARARALMKKQCIDMYYIRTTEPHKDSTPHSHIMLWTKDAEETKRILQKHFMHSGRALDIKDLGYQSDDENSNAKATSYLLKYLVKTVGTDDALKNQFNDASIDRVDAWRATYAIRSIQFGGLPRGAVGIWRETRRIDPKSEDYEDEIPDSFVPTIKAARANDFLRFWNGIKKHGISLMKECEKDRDLCSADDLEFFAAGGGKRVIGIKSEAEGWSIKTRRGDWTLDFNSTEFFNELNENVIKIKQVTIIHNAPRGKPNHGWNREKSWKSRVNAAPLPQTGPPMGQTAGWQIQN